MPTHSCLLPRCCLAAPLLTLSPPFVQRNYCGSASLHRRFGWMIPCLRIQPQNSGLHLGPFDPAAHPWILAPSSPLWPGSTLALPCFLVPPAPAWSDINHLYPQDSTPSALRRPSSSVRLLRPYSSSSVLCRSSSTAAFQSPVSASVT